MTAGLIDFNKRGDDDQPSPSVWASCPRTLLNDLGLGSYVHNAFLGDTATLPGMLDDSTGTGTFAYAGDERHLRMGTGTSDNDSNLIFTRPLGRIVRNAGENHRLWYEARVAPVALDDRAMFFGFAEPDMVADGGSLLADDPSNSDQAGLENGSLIGFVSRQVGSEARKLDLVIRKDDGSVQTILEDVTNASALNAQRHPGGEVQADLRGDLAAGEFIKLGLAYLGNLNQVRAYVKGVEVARIDVDPSIDQATAYAPVVALHSGSASAKSLDVDFFRAASQVRT